MIVQLIADEQRRKVNLDIGEFLTNIRRLVNKINGAEQQTDYQMSALLQDQLSQEVDDLNSRIGGGIDSLWNRLNTDLPLSVPYKRKSKKTKKLTLKCCAGWEAWS